MKWKLQNEPNPDAAEASSLPNKPIRGKLRLYAERYTLDADYRTNPISKHKKPCYRVKNAEMEVEKVAKKTKQTQS
jgi:hypothetical protein